MGASHPDLAWANQGRLAKAGHYSRREVAGWTLKSPKVGPVSSTVQQINIFIESRLEELNERAPVMWGIVSGR